MLKIKKTYAKREQTNDFLKNQNNVNLDKQRLKAVSESPSLKEESDLFQLFVLKSTAD